ncbi:MAG TPA: ferredoxin [Baekduia sp.]|uniref:ferredoxin n=1 Tax=Baekduia sp. TaxID=2600305 RepID=UPI002D791CC9|nr:ferredoxin [Baekduia sp.]HET6509962.1 ferredoxin [Baekduia sp.]
MKIVVDRERCVAGGECVLACGEVFAQDDDGIVVVVDEHPPEELREAVEEAIEACPAAIIEAVDDAA